MTEEFLYLKSFYSLSPLWQKILQPKLKLLKQIDQKLVALANKETIYPPQQFTFSALQQVPADKVKVVIIGQDPYHGDRQANGLAFAVNNDVKTLPPSLYNIYQEILINNFDYNQLQPQTIKFIENFKKSTNKHSILNKLHPRMINTWPRQGVLLINSALTVLAHRANSLQQLGWQEITNHIITTISQINDSCVFMLWGNYARGYKNNIDTDKNHLILESTHPSPLSAHRGFFGCQHFKKANLHLPKQDSVKWIIEN